MLDRMLNSSVYYMSYPALIKHLAAGTGLDTTMVVVIRVAKKPSPNSTVMLVLACTNSTRWSSSYTNKGGVFMLEVYGGEFRR